MKDGKRMKKLKWKMLSVAQVMEEKQHSEEDHMTNFYFKYFLIILFVEIKY